MWNHSFKKYFKVTWFGEFGCGYPTDEEFCCMASSKRDAHRKFIEFLGDNVNRQYTCEERLLSFKETEPEITEVTRKEYYDWVNKEG